MLIRRDVLDAIVDGRVTVQFRRWRRPTVRAGGTLRTAVGTLAIDAVEVVDVADVSDADARAAGAPDRVALLASLRQPAPGTHVHRISLRHLGADARRALAAEHVIEAEEMDALTSTLAAIDARSRRGPWTDRVLGLVARRPAEAASVLAAELGRDTASFKRDVRRLKELGLTESLDVGYRLSPRGVTYVRRRGGAPEA